VWVRPNSGVASFPRWILRPLSHSAKVLETLISRTVAIGPDVEATEIFNPPTTPSRVLVVPSEMLLYSSKCGVVKLGARASFRPEAQVVAYFFLSVPVQHQYDIQIT
jgi:hypothetical protein